MRFRMAMIVSLTGALLVSGCNKKEAPEERQKRVEAQRAAAEARQAESATRAAERKMKMAEEQKVREEKMQAEKELKRSFMDVQFHGIDPKGYPKVVLANRSGKDIQDLRGAFRAEDKEGKSLFSTGLTMEMGPGKVYIAKDSSVEQSPYGLNRKEALMGMLKADPTSLVFFFEASAITYSDGTEEERLKQTK